MHLICILRYFTINPWLLCQQLMKDLVQVFKILNVCADRISDHPIYTKPMLEILKIARFGRLQSLFSVFFGQLDSCDNSTHVTTQLMWQVDPFGKSTHLTSRPMWQVDPFGKSTHLTSRPLWQLNLYDNYTFENLDHWNKVTFETRWPLKQGDLYDNTTLVTNKLDFETNRSVWQLDY